MLRWLQKSRNCLRRTSVVLPVRIFHASPIYSHGGHSHGLPVFEKNEEAREACERITKVGMLVNGALVAGKGFAGVFGNSHALIADAAHSLSDFASDLVTLYVVKQVRKPHTKKYPYGFGRYEAVGSLAVGSLLLSASGGILWSSTRKLMSELKVNYFPEWDSMAEWLPEAHSHTIELASSGPASIAMVAALASIVSKEWVYRVTAKVGKKYNSQVIMANAFHHRTDAFSSIIAVVGVGGSMLCGVPWIDTIAGIFVGGMVAKTAFAITKESILDLTDHDVHAPLRKELITIINTTSGVNDFHRLRIRKMGPFYAVDAHIVVDGLLSVSAAHQIAERVRYEIQDSLESVTDVMIHVDPDESATLHRMNDEERYEIAKKKGTIHFEHDEEYLQRPQEEVQCDVQRIVDQAKDVQSISHFTCHYLNGKLFVEMEVKMGSDLRITEVTAIAKLLRADIISQVNDIHDVDIHLEIFE